MLESRFSGTIYLNGRRYWWKVRFPGSDKISQIPLKAKGARLATTDWKSAEVIAGDLWQKVLRDEKPKAFDGKLATLIQLYREHTKKIYLPPSKEAENIRPAIIPLGEFFPNMKADDFTPVDLKQFRENLIESEKDYCRSTINRRIGMIQRMFKWAASEMLVSIHTFQAVATVEGLRKGRTNVKEGKKVLPAPQEHIDALLPFMSKTAAKIMTIQSYTGMRSSEICQMTTAQIEKKGNMLYYRPRHKTEYLGHDKIVPLGPKSQEIIKPLLKPEKPFECLFLTCHGRPFNKRSYHQEFENAFDRAKAAGVEIPYFYPHRIRHTVGTSVRSKYGLDTARAMLGHRKMSMTTEYAELDLKKAEKVAKMIG